MSTLYDITGDLLQIQEMLNEDPFDETLNDTFEAVAGELEVKAEGYCKVMKNFEAESEMLKNEIDRLTAKKKVADNSVDRLKKALYSAMIATKTPKIKGELFTLTVRNNAPQLPKELDSLDVPKEYLIKQEPTIDRRTLLADVKAGKVRGIDLVTSTSLTIK